MIKHKYTKDMLVEAVKASNNVTEVLRYLNIRLTGGSHSHISRRIKELCIDTSHFLGSRANCGKNHVGGKLKTPDDILVKRDITFGKLKRQHSDTLRWAMLEKGVPYKCSACGVEKYYNGKLIIHQVDHINRDWLDDRLENLRFLCPNCHSQTIGWCGSTKETDEFRITGRKINDRYKLDIQRSRGKVKIEEQLCFEFSSDRKSKSNRNSRISHPCLHCGKETDQSKYCSYECTHKGQRKFNPSKEELENLIKQYPYEKIGEMFGVSGNAVKKRARKLGIVLKNRLGFWAQAKSNKIRKVKSLFDN